MSTAAMIPPPVLLLLGIEVPPSPLQLQILLAWSRVMLESECIFRPCIHEGVALRLLVNLLS